MDSWVRRIATAARRPIPSASATAFRVAFGGLVVYSTVRFVARGWVNELYLAPRHHLTYADFGWVRPLPAPLMYAHMVVLAVLGVAIAIGYRPRLAAGLFAVGFAYVELIDAALYLNHYWFVTLAAVVLAVAPAPRAGVVPAVTVWALRGQIAVVYVFAGIAKLNSDWLFRAEPMQTWLSARTDRPLIGPWLDEAAVAFAFSWAGALFDLTIVGWLLWRRSRPFAYVAVVIFHAATAMLFQIGVFPWVMIALTPIFFAPDWPTAFRRRIAAAWPAAPHRARTVCVEDSAERLTNSSTQTSPAAASGVCVEDSAERPTDCSTQTSAAASGVCVEDSAERPTDCSTQTSVAAASGVCVEDLVGRPADCSTQTSVGGAGGAGCGGRRIGVTGGAVLGVLAVVNIALPLRHYAADGNVRFNDDGYYLSWRVMLTERSGFLEYDVVDPATGVSTLVRPDLVLEDWQIAQATSRPDLILATAHLIAAELAARGQPGVEVYANAWVTVNGRPRQRWIDPEVDLASLSRSSPAARYVLPIGTAEGKGDGGG